MLHDSTQGCKDNTRRRNQLSGRTLANRPRRQIDNVRSWRQCRMRGPGSGQDQVINRHCKDSAFYAGPIRCRLGSVFHAHGCKRGRPHSGEFGCEPSDCTWPIAPVDEPGLNGRFSRLHLFRCYCYGRVAPSRPEQRNNVARSSEGQAFTSGMNT